MNEDLSSIFEKFNINKDAISPEMVDNIMNIIHNNSSANSDSETNTSNKSPDIDIETILRMKSIMDKINVKNDDPRSRLLNSLRPYLKESKQSKLDQYIQLMNMSKIIEILPFIGGDSHGHK